MNARHLLFPLLMGSFTATHAQPFQKQPNASGLSFVENKGQVTDQYRHSRSDIDFRIRGGSGINLFVGDVSLHYQWAKPIGKKVSGNDTLQQLAMYRMDVTLVGADPQAKVITEQKQDFFERYYTPLFGEQGTIAHAYQKVTYKNVYPDIDWVLYVKDNTVEYDFVVRQGGKVSDIKLQYGGATKLNVDKAGRLTAITPMGSVTEHAPVSFQADGKSIVSSFVLKDNTLGFSTGDYSGTLTIDPTLTWSTFYGDVSAEAVRNGCVTGDKYSNGYLCGNTGSTANIATTGSYMDTLAGSTDAFLAKFNSSGTGLWATYYGGSDAENSYGVTCDTSGNVYLSGYTTSTSGIATTGAYQTVQAGSTDAFLVKFDTGGVRQWATYLGGSGTEQCFGVTCDKSNNVYICGYTQSTSGIASMGAHQTTFGGASDAYLAKFNSVGTLQWASYYGGSLLDYGQSLTCDAYRNVYLCGYTRSTTDIATTGAFRTNWNAGDDAYLVKFDSSGVRQWGTYYGGAVLDRGISLCADPNNNVYMAGATTSDTGIATSGGAQATFGGGLSADAYLVKFNGSGERQWATYYGTSAIDDAGWVCADQSGYLYLFGRTASATGIATTGAWKDTLDGTTDAMLVKFDTSGTRQWATYFGGDATEIAYGVFCNGQSQVFIGGQTTSSGGLGTSGAFQTIYGGSNDGFLAVFNDCSLTAPASITGSDTTCSNISYTYSVPLVPDAISYNWTLPTGWIGTSTTNTITLTTGINSDTIRVAANYACGTSDEITKAITIVPLPTITPSGTINICAGDSTTLSATTGVAYEWYKDGVPVSGATSQLYTVHNTGHYSAIVTSSFGCVDTTLADTVIANPLPVPVITASGTVLGTGSYASYQWNHNDTAITGATGASYTIIIPSGSYTVSVTDANGCSGTSAPFDGGTVGIDDKAVNGLQVRVYPNPTSNQVHIEAGKKINVTVSSIEGRIQGFYTDAKDIDVSHLANGMYLLRITDKSGTFLHTEKLVISHNQ